jgi:hypothetical protein
MKSIINHREQLALSAAFQHIVKDLEPITSEVASELLTEHLTNSLGHHIFADPMVIKFLNTVTNKDLEIQTVGEFRTGLIEALSTKADYFVAREWDVEEGKGGLKELYDLCSRGVQQRNINQILAAIGGKGLNDSFETAEKSPPTYSKGSEYPRVKYSLGLKYIVYDADGYYPMTVGFNNYQTTNLEQLMDESKFVTEWVLTNLLNIELDTYEKRQASVLHITVFMNNIETLQISINQNISNFINNSFDLKEKLTEAKSFVGGTGFVEKLMNGELFKSEQYREHCLKLKGRGLEDELGI